MLLNRYNSAPNGDKLTVKDGENIGVIHWRGWTDAQEDPATADTVHALDDMDKMVIIVP